MRGLAYPPMTRCAWVCLSFLLACLISSDTNKTSVVHSDDSWVGQYGPLLRLCVLKLCDFSQSGRYNVGSSTGLSQNAIRVGDGFVYGLGECEILPAWACLSLWGLWTALSPTSETFEF